MGNKNDFYFEMTKTVLEIDPLDLITANNSYIIFRSKKGVRYIYDIKDKRKIEFDYRFSIIKMHPKFQNIFLIAEGNIAKIFEINKKPFEYIEKSKVNGHTQNIKLAEFSNYNDKIFVTYSYDKTIKVWNLDIAFCICNILLIDPIEDFQIYKEFIFYYDKKKSCVIKYNYEKLEEFNYAKINLYKFIVMNEKEIIGIDDNRLIKYSDNKEINSLEIKNFPKYLFKEENLDFLYLFFYDNIVVLDTKNMKLIFEKEINYSEVIHLNNYNKNFLYTDFILLRQSIEYYTFHSISNYGKKDNNLHFSGIDFWQKTIPSISSIENLEWKANMEEKYKYKKYLDDDIILEELNKNYSKHLNQKKIEVEEELKVNKTFDYIQLLKLLIKDNTNKLLVSEYLKFLEKNKKLNFKNAESSNDEYEKYKIMFTIQELNSYGLKELNIPRNIEKNSSEKKVFETLLSSIIKLDTKDSNSVLSFKDKVKQELNNLQLFNQPIDLLLNNELYWYRNKFTLLFALDKIIDDKKQLELMKNSINIIIEKKLLEADYIINNSNLLTSIMILIAIPQPIQLLEFNLNLIETLDPNYNVQKELETNKMNKLTDENDSYAAKIKNKPVILCNASSSCINNFILNYKDNMNFEPIELKNYESMKEEFNKIIDFEQMYTFLSKIICSPVFKEAFYLLYPKYLVFPFKTEEDSLKFLKKYFHFIPLKSARTGAITEKFSLEIYYLLKTRKINISQYVKEEINILINKIFHRGALVKISCHEMNHDFYNIFLMHSNGKIPLETPRKKFIEEREGGKNMERLLFNQPIRKLTLKQCMYLLNLKNYGKSLKEFKEGFNELNIKDLKIEDKGIFHELNDIFDIDNFPQLSIESNVRCDDNDENSNFFSDSYVEDIEDVNDILGFIREPSKLN